MKNSTNGRVGSGTMAEPGVNTGQETYKSAKAAVISYVPTRTMEVSEEGGHFVRSKRAEGTLRVVAVVKAIGKRCITKKTF